MVLPKPTRAEKQASELSIARPDPRQPAPALPGCDDEQPQLRQVKRDFLDVVKKQFPQQTIQMSLSNKKVIRSSSSRKAARKELAESGRAIAQVRCFQIGGADGTRAKQPLRKLALQEDKSPHHHNMSPPQDNEQVMIG